MDGDAKICFKEFEIGMRSQLTVFGSGRQRSSSRRNRSAATKEMTTPKNASKVARPGTAGRPANQRRRETELYCAKSK